METFVGLLLMGVCLLCWRPFRELLAGVGKGIVIAGVILFWPATIYIAVHFILKFW